MRARRRSAAILQTDRIEHSAIAIVAADSTRERVIARLPRYDSDDNFPMLSPDGRTVLSERATSPIGHPRLSHASFTVNADGGGLAASRPGTCAPATSPTGRNGGHILFPPTNIDDFAKSQRYTIHPDGTHLPT